MRPAARSCDTVIEASVWDQAGAYEHFMGRWSRGVARTIFDSSSMRLDGRCLDVGCAVGSLSGTVIERFDPEAIVGIDRSADFLGVAGVREPTLMVAQADASRLPFASDVFDAAVSGLVLNFVADPRSAMAEIVRVVRPGGTVVVYVWDYDHPDFFLTRFWNAIEAVRGRRDEQDERGRWPVCSEDGMRRLARSCGLPSDAVRPVETTCAFEDADELWDGFPLGVGPSGRTALTLTDHERDRVRAILTDRLPLDDRGRVSLTARAIALEATAAS